MFRNCANLETADLSGLDVSGTGYVDRMFDMCNSLVAIYVPCTTDWGGISGAAMFIGCTSLAGGYGTAYDSAHVGSSYARVDGLGGEPGYFTTIHVVQETVVPATLARDGAITGDCGICRVTLSATIPRPASFALSDTSFAYDGEPKQPDVTVKDGNGREIAASNYDVGYAGNTDAGTATATVTFKGGLYEGSKEVEFTIAKAAISPEVSIEGWTYGEAAKQPALVGGSNPGDGAVAFEYKPRASGDDGYAADVPSAAGSYTVRATVAETANHRGGSATADFSIAKAKVPIPEAKTGLVYNGEEQTGVEKGEGYTVVGGSATAAGSHTATASLVDKANTQWADETTDDKVIAFEIASPEIAIPKAKAGLVYNGKSQTGVEEGPGYTVSGGSATAAGSHTATASLVDKANAKWSDGTTEDKEVAFAIAKAKVAVPKAKSGLVYNGKSQTGVPAGAGYTVKGGQATKAGSYTATLTADANHVFSTGKATASVAWKIAKANGAVAIKAKSSKPVAIAAGKSVLATKALKVTKNASKGKVSYKKVKGDKRIVVKSGKITVKKGLKKGTYTIKVKAVSAATANYKAATSKAVALKVRVR